MASTGFLSCPDRNRLRSESLRRPNSLLEPSAEVMKKRLHFLESVAQTEVPNLARRETTYSTIVANRTPSPMSSPTARLLRPSGGEDEALSSSDPAALALPGTPSCPDRERCRSNSHRGMIEPEERTKSPLERFMAKDDESRNVGRSKSANMIVADSFSTSVASTTAVRRRPRRRHPGRHSVPKASRKIPLVDHPQASTLDGLHRRPRISEGPPGEVKSYRGIRYRPDRRKWVAAMKPPNSKNKCFFGDFESEIQAACAVAAAYFYYERPDQTNILHSTPAMMTMLPTLPAGLNKKDKLVFVKDEAKRLAKYAADNLEAVNPSFGRKKQW